MFRTFSPEAFLWLVQAPISLRRKGAGLCGPIARYSSAADAMKRQILASKAPFCLMSPRPRSNVLIATVIAQLKRPKMNDLVAVQKIVGWDKLKALVLDSVSSPITKRVYNMALDEFLVWFQQAPRPGFTKATVSAWRVSLEVRGLGSSSIIIRMSAIRKLAAEAADNGLLAPELAAGIARVRTAKSVGIRVGNWLSVRQAQSLLNAPDVSTARGLRDRSILAVLLGAVSGDLT